MSERLQNDVDPIETRDWQQAIESVIREEGVERAQYLICLLYTSPSPRDGATSRMPSSA